MEALAARSSLTPARIIEDALSHGLSLAWQERWAEGVLEGVADADRGNFAIEDEIAAVLNRFNQS